MSVIHEMLTELDARHAPRPPTLGDYTFAALPRCSVDAPYRPITRWLAAGAVLIGAAGLVSWYQFAGLGTEPAPRNTLDEALNGVITGALHDPPSAGVQAPPPAAPRRPSSTPTLKPALAAAHTQRPSQQPGAGEPVPTQATNYTPQLALWTPPPEQAASPVLQPSPQAASASAASIEKRLVPPSTAQRAALAYRQAVELAGSGHGAQAIDKAKEALKADPDHTAARQLAATLLFENSRLDEASALLQEGLDRQPHQPPLVYLLARLKAEAGDAAGALATLAQADELSADGHGLRAVILARQGRYREALPAYEAAARLAPLNASWWLGLGVALDAEGQSANAVRALQRARALGSLNAELLAFVDQKLAALK